MRNTQNMASTLTVKADLLKKHEICFLMASLYYLYRGMQDHTVKVLPTV